MTLTKDQGQRSRSNVIKLAKMYKMGHISDAISPTDFILSTKVKPDKAHSITQVPITLILGQGHRSRSNFPRNGKKLNNWPYLGGYFTYRLHTWYQGTTQLGAFNNSIADDLDPRSRSRSKVKVKFSSKIGKKTKKLVISRRLFHLHTSYLAPRYNPIRHKC